MTDVHAFVTDGDLDGLARLVASDPKVLDEATRLGFLPVHTAAESGDDRALRVLLVAGADPDSPTGLDPVHERRMAEMRARGMVMDAFRDERRPLHVATSAAAVDALVASGATLEAEDALAQTPLATAARMGVPDVVRALLAVGAVPSGLALAAAAGTDPHDRCESGECLAAAVTSLLLDAGAPVDQPDDGGRTPLWYHVWMGHPESVSLLLSAGADPLCRDAGGQSPWHLSRQRFDSALAAILDAATPAPHDVPVDLAEVRTMPAYRLDIRADLAVVASADGVVSVWQMEATDASPLHAVRTDHEFIQEVTVAQDVVVVASSSVAEVVSWPDLTSVTPPPWLPVKRDPRNIGVGHVGVSPDGMLAAVTGSEPQTVAVVAWESGKLVGVRETGEYSTSLVFSPASSQLAFVRGYQGGATLAVMAVSAAGVADERELDLNDLRPGGWYVDEPGGPAWSPDGQRLAVPLRWHANHEHAFQFGVAVIEVNGMTAAVTPLDQRQGTVPGRLFWRSDDELIAPLGAHVHRIARAGDVLQTIDIGTVVRAVRPWRDTVVAATDQGLRILRDI